MLQRLKIDHRYWLKHGMASQGMTVLRIAVSQATRIHLRLFRTTVKLQKSLTCSQRCGETRRVLERLRSLSCHQTQSQRRLKVTDSIIESKRKRTNTTKRTMKQRKSNSSSLLGVKFKDDEGYLWACLRSSLSTRLKGVKQNFKFQTRKNHQSSMAIPLRLLFSEKWKKEKKTRPNALFAIFSQWQSLF